MRIEGTVFYQFFERWTLGRKEGRERKERKRTERREGTYGVSDDCLEGTTILSVADVDGGAAVSVVTPGWTESDDVVIVLLKKKVVSFSLCLCLLKRGSRR